MIITVLIEIMADKVVVDRILIDLATLIKNIIGNNILIYYLKLVIMSKETISLMIFYYSA